MKLIGRLENDGAFLFRWRSYLPLVLAPVTAAALGESAGIDQAIGEGLDDAWMLLCLGVSLGGLAIRWLTVGCIPAGTSGRNTRSQRADTLNTTGMYSIVRNPLYLGNFLALMGIVMAIKVWWLVAIVALAYWLYIERVIAAEERYLSGKFSDPFRVYISNVPVFLPSPFIWRSPKLGFSLRTVLRREYNGIMAVAAGFFMPEIFVDLLVEHEILLQWIYDDWIWPFLFLVAAVLFIVLRTLKKSTNLLDVPGRR